MSDTPKSAPSEIDEAFIALATYSSGGNRSALMPLDEAVTASLSDRGARISLEERLVGILDSNAASAAKQYACGKLILVGTDRCIKSVARLLSDAEVAADARSVLEALPGNVASSVLKKSLSSLSGLQKAGAEHSLQVRRQRKL